MDAETRRGVRVGVRLAFAHHPLCRRFDGDVLHRRLPVCSGCALTWPLFFLSLPLAYLGLVRDVMSPWGCVLVGVAMGLPQLTTYVVRWPRPARRLIKAAGGVGLAFAVTGGLLLPWSMAAKAVAAGLVLLAFVGMQALRMRRVLKVCRACPWGMDWRRCPGFRPEGGWEDPPRGHQGPGRLFPKAKLQDLPRPSRVEDGRAGRSWSRRRDVRRKL